MAGKSIDGIVEYQSREYCKDVKCPYQLELNRMQKDTPEYDEFKIQCQEECAHTRLDFMQWLVGHDYKIQGLDKSSQVFCSAKTAYEFHDWLKKEGMRILKKNGK